MFGSLQLIKTKIDLLYKNKTDVHINLSVARSKEKLKKINGVINGVYPNIFTVTIANGEIKKDFAFQYADVLTGIVEITELK